MGHNYGLCVFRYELHTMKYNLIISLKSYILSHKKVEERLADSVEVSTIVVNMIFERNTPKLNLTLYVPILILLALFLGSILIPSKLLHYENRALIVWPPNDRQNIFSVASGEKLGFQITLLLASYIYFDVFQDLLPPFEKTVNTPAALIFFVILIIIQFFTIIGSDLKSHFMLHKLCKKSYFI